MIHLNLIKYISIADRYSKSRLDQKLAPLNINSSHHMYILRICENPGLTQEQLMSMFHIHPSNVTRALKHLHTAGFIYRETNETDKRTSRLYPTQKAKDACIEIHRIKQEIQSCLLKDIDVKEQARFYEQLKSVAMRAVSLTDTENTI